ncbi:MAG: RNA-binding protein, partial [Mesorhizobium sp.]
KELGSKGGKKRAANMTPERRREIAQAAARKRWGK